MAVYRAVATSEEPLNWPSVTIGSRQLLECRIAAPRVRHNFNLLAVRPFDRRDQVVAGFIWLAAEGRHVPFDGAGGSGGFRWTVDVVEARGETGSSLLMQCVPRNAHGAAAGTNRYSPGSRVNTVKRYFVCSQMGSGMAPMPAMISGEPSPLWSATVNAPSFCPVGSSNSNRAAPKLGCL